MSKLFKLIIINAITLILAYFGGRFLIYCYDYFDFMSMETVLRIYLISRYLSFALLITLIIAIIVDMLNSWKIVNNFVISVILLKTRLFKAESILNIKEE